MSDSATEDAETTRRGLLRRGLALAVATPALVTALNTATAWADDDDDNDDDDDDNDDRRQGHADARQPQFSTGLCRVSEASGFTGTGTDSLTSGRLRLVGRRNNHDDDKIAVVLRGAPVGASYNVMFLPSSGGRESLGSVGPTNNRGSLAALTPNPLSGAHRVGIFVLVRNGGNEDGRDEFVSCLGD